METGKANASVISQALFHGGVTCLLALIITEKAAKEKKGTMNGRQGETLQCSGSLGITENGVPTVLGFEEPDYSVCGKMEPATDGRLKLRVSGLKGLDISSVMRGLLPL